MLYSKNGQYPTLLPNRIRLPDGSTRTDPTTFTEDILLLAGYVAVENPPSSINSNEQLSWTGTEWNIIEINNAISYPELPPLE